MTILERRMIEVDGTTLEIFVSDDRGPVICEAHPYGGYTGKWRNGIAVLLQPGSSR